MAKEKNETPKYINAPLHIFKNFQNDPVATINKFLDVGIYRFAKKVNYSHNEVFRQLIYGYKYHFDHLSRDLVYYVNGVFNKYGFTADSGYLNFSNDKTFDIQPFIDKEINGFSTSNIIDEAILYYQLEQTKKLIGLTFIYSNIINSYRKFEIEDHEFTKKYGKDASVSLTIDMLFDYLTHEKKQLELDLFSAYFAIKSIQGTSEYCKTNKAFIKMRMLGAKSKKVLTDHLKPSENKGFYKRIDNRYQIDKIIQQLLVKGFLQSKIGIDRYLYLSTQLSYDLLPQAIAAANKPKILKNQEQAAKEQLNRLLNQ